MLRFRGLFITDLDGTLHHRERGIAASAWSALATLRAQKICVVVSTGRNLRGALAVLPSDLPLDYLAFSTGAGLRDWNSGAVTRRATLNASTARAISFELVRRRLDFTLHDPIPDNHLFSYHTGCGGKDHLARIERNRVRGRPWSETESAEATQFVVIHEHGARFHEEARTIFRDLSIVRSTSPFDGRSVWTEILPAGTSKSTNAEALRLELGISQEATCAVGNDYNDEDLLAWARHRLVAPAAPADLRACFGSAKADVVTEAAHSFLAQLR